MSELGPTLRMEWLANTPMYTSGAATNPPNENGGDDILNPHEGYHFEIPSPKYFPGPPFYVDPGVTAVMRAAAITQPHGSYGRAAY